VSDGMLTAYRVVAERGDGVVVCADSEDALALLPDNCCHAIVTDPPYGLAFMGRKWDGDVPGPGVWQQCLRVAVPGAHLLAFGSARTHHRLWAAIEDASWGIRGTLTWHYGQGFPKGGDVSKGIDKAAGAERELGPKRVSADGTVAHDGAGKRHSGYERPWRSNPEAVDRNTRVSYPATEDAKKWAGWQANVKPATEFVCLARKPMSEKNLAANVLRWGTGALNIGGRRVGTAQTVTRVAETRFDGSHYAHGQAYRPPFVREYANPPGRVPADLLLSHHPACRVRDCHRDCPVRILDEQSGELTSGRMRAGTQRTTGGGYSGGFPGCATEHDTPGDTGGASRFFPTIECADEDLDFIRFRYCPKASRSERTCGGAVVNRHPTVKPIALMRWLVGLVARPGQMVLDPFAGSGTTGIAAAREGLRYILIEQDAGHAATARKRIAGGPLLAGGEGE